MVNNWIGSAEHRKMVNDSKKDILEIIKVASEFCLRNPNPVMEAKIKEVWEWYKKL